MSADRKLRTSIALSILLISLPASNRSSASPITWMPLTEIEEIISASANSLLDPVTSIDFDTLSPLLRQDFNFNDHEINHFYQVLFKLKEDGNPISVRGVALLLYQFIRTRFIK